MEETPGVVQCVKDTELLQLSHRFDPWPQNFHVPQVWQKKKKKKRKGKRKKKKKWNKLKKKGDGILKLHSL